MTRHEMKGEQDTSWASDEFAEVSLGDKRLDARLITLCDRFSDAPESPINQACADWAETKAAYRFFQNENVDVAEILAAHRSKTAKRASKHKTVLAIQDTSYFVYTSHPKTEGLGKLSLKKGKRVKEIDCNGLLMHSCLAVTTEGLPLGLLDQKIYSRKLYPDKIRRDKSYRPREHLPVAEKESARWLESLAHTKEVMGDTEVVTVCDREAVRLWEHIRQQPETGSYTIDIPRRSKTKHAKEREARNATVTVRFGSFCLNPPRNYKKHGEEDLPNIDMNGVYVLEKDPPECEEPVEWMLLSTLPVTSFDEACEKVLWYSLRWRIETYHKVLKSGFRVEACRLGHAERLARYLTIMSIVAWRLFMITLVARTDPTTPCSSLLAEQEWKALCLKTNRGKPLPRKPPPIGDVVIWVAKLGGYLARKSDGPPGTITLWRGWKRLADLTEGWNLATES